MKTNRHIMMKILLLVFSVFCSAVFGFSQAEEETHSSHPVTEANASDGNGPAEAGNLEIQVPKEFQSGEERFNTFCSRCHGVYGRGTGNGPPLVHKIYEPSHHADIAFFRAAAQGVRAHHWEFGNMPPITDATPDDVALIVQYIRWLQREAGIH